tara:strand:- start:58 stop:474 length:417 start_codon:yes stop_codon:yes gene_type:complete
MKMSKKKWYIWSKLTKGQLANEYDKLQSKCKKLQENLDSANKSFNIYFEENDRLTNLLDKEKNKIKSLELLLKDQELDFVKKQVNVLEKLVALYEKKPKDEIRYISYENNGHISPNSTRTDVTTTSTGFLTGATTFTK